MQGSRPPAGKTSRLPDGATSHNTCLRDQFAATGHVLIATIARRCDDDAARGHVGDAPRQDPGASANERDVLIRWGLLLSHHDYEVLQKTCPHVTCTDWQRAAQKGIIPNAQYIFVCESSVPECGFHAPHKRRRNTLSTSSGSRCTSREARRIAGTSHSRRGGSIPRPFAVWSTNLGWSGLAARGTRHRRAAVELGTALAALPVNEDRAVLFPIARQLLLDDPEGWRARLGGLVFDKTLQDLLGDRHQSPSRSFRPRPRLCKVTSF
jgi:hypothetical protein